MTTIDDHRQLPVTALPYGLDRGPDDGHPDGSWPEPEARTVDRVVGP